MRAVLAIILISISLPATIYGQLPPYYTQYLTNEFVINPAYAGAEDALSITLIHRSQWINVEGMPETQTLAGHSLIKNKNIGIGALLTYDQIGVHRMLIALSAYSFRLNLDEKRYLSMGLQAGIRNQKSDYASLAGQVQNPLDPKIYIDDPILNSFEFGAGLYYSGPRLKWGISVPKMLTTSKQFNDSVSIQFNRHHLFSTLSYRFPLSRNIELQPGLLVKYAPDLPVSYDLNLQTIINEALTLGMSVRLNTSVNFLMQAKVTPQLSVGYAYDHPTGEMAIYDQGSHELMVRYLFRFFKSNVERPR